MDVLSANPEVRERTRNAGTHEKHGAGVTFLLATFLWPRKEK